MSRAPFPATIPVSVAPRLQGLEAHARNIRRLNVALDAAVLVARSRNLIPAGAAVEVTGARNQNFVGSRAHHAAHGMKRFTFGGRDIVAIYQHPSVDPLMGPLLTGLLGSTTSAEATANLSIDRSLEGNPARRQQLQDAVDGAWPNPAVLRAQAEAMQRDRMVFDRAVLLRLRLAHVAEPAYLAMLAIYQPILCGPPLPGESPGAMVAQMLSVAF